MQTEESKSGMAAEVAKNHQEAKASASKNRSESEEELPRGAEASEGSTEITEEAAAPEATEPEKAAAGEPETLIRIGDKEFKTESEAFAYARENIEKLEQEKLINEAYSTGVREAIQARTPVAEETPVEDNFEERFYSNPKEALRAVEERATQRALQSIQAEQRKENLWKQFFDENPDLDGQRSICEMVLNQNAEIFDKMTDTGKAMKILAQKTRSHFTQYIEKTQPRTELSSKKGQTSVQSSGSPARVTPDKKNDAPLTMAQQMRILKEKRQ